MAELVAPAHDTAEGRVARWRRRPHPARRVLVVAVAPVLPGLLLRSAVVVDDELVVEADQAVERVLADLPS